MNASPNSMSDWMDDRIALHTAARRYCEDRYSEWAEAYNKLEEKENARIEKKFELGWDYSEEAYSIFPRYRIDKGIRIEVERLVPQSSRNLEDLRSQLIRACDIAEARLHAELANTIARKALREECEDFRAYIRALSKTDLVSIAPLPLMNPTVRLNSQFSDPHIFWVQSSTARGRPSIGLCMLPTNHR